MDIVDIISEFWIVNSAVIIRARLCLYINVYESVNIRIHLSKPGIVGVTTAMLQTLVFINS